MPDESSNASTTARGRELGLRARVPRHRRGRPRADAGGRQMTAPRAPISEAQPGLDGTPRDAGPGWAAGLAAWTSRPLAWCRLAWRRLARELVFAAIFGVIYEELRDHMVQAGSVAASHALSIVSAERDLGLFREQAVQLAV